MSSIKLHFEIGHSAERKAKPSKHGFTHDWELFVKSPNDSNDISQFIEKVVFNLHESFPKPKRVIKDPPYVVKESGYAGFELTIDIYLRNRDEPKKITFPYDMDLQPFKSEVKEFIVNNPADDFKRKCIKAGCQVVGGSSDYKSKDYKPSSSSGSQEIKKPKRPEDKTKSYFTELFGDPIEKSSAKVVNKKEEKLPPPQPSSSSHKEKEKSKHKHSPVVDSKDSKSKKNDDRSAPGSEKPKKDKTRDRERSEKKEKSAKRAPSPPVSSNSRPPSSSQPAPSKPPQDYQKSSQPKQPTPVVEQPAQQSTSSSTKKSNKKKNYEKDREKKESKKNAESPVTKKPPKEEPSAKFDSRDKASKPKPSTSEVKALPEVKKHENVEVERKHKHKKKEKSKEKEKKEKPPKSQPQPAPAPAPVRTQTPVSSKSATKFEKPPPVSDNSSDSEMEATPIKQEEPVVEFKAQPEPERHHTKNPREKSQKSNVKEDKKRKRAAEKEERDSSASPPPAKSNKKEPSPSPTSNQSSKSTNNNNKQQDTPNDLKVTTEYLDELKDLKHKITTLKNNDHLQHVVRLIASTGCYEITKSTFDFDLVQLDKTTVQRLQEFFAN